MKRTLALLLTGCSGAAPVLAQSAVTIFGIVDMRLSHIKNSGAPAFNGVSHSGIGPSRWGLRGTEDLGGGLYAGFHLEAQIKPDTGESNTTYWNRQATVRLGSRSLGELRLGRDVVPSYRITTQYDPFTANGIGSNINILSAGPNPNHAPAALRIKTFNQASNAIGYFLPGEAKEYGLSGQLMFAPGEGGTADKYSGAYLEWKHQGFSVGGHFAQIDPATGGSIVKYTTKGIAAAYQFSTGTKLMAMIQDERSKRSTAVPYEERWWQIGAVQNVGAGDIRLSFVRRNATGTVKESANDATLWAVGYVHRLSKRTAVYTMYAKLDNKGAGTTFLPNGAQSIAPGGNSAGLDFGIHHKF
ncbi:porin [Ideonella azotifigens]|uniref:porin n=1 Tax=Ideonella azotifigens TaxID=513160 RepID=UPI001476F32A|nr:porin [Ideonella azotifigens]MCD2342929.1 porin [Ideonella azotifigens]